MWVLATALPQQGGPGPARGGKDASTRHKPEMLFYLHHKSNKLSDEVQNAGLRGKWNGVGRREGHRRRENPAHTQQNENEKTENKISNSTEQKKEPLEGPDDPRERITLQEKQEAGRAVDPMRSSHRRPGDTAWRPVCEKLLGEQGLPPSVRSMKIS